MAMPKFTVKTKYAAKGGDLVLLPYENSKNALFPKTALNPELVDALEAPGDAGGSSTIFGGKLGRTRAIAKTLRLDAEHSTPTAELSKAVAAALGEAKKEGCKQVVVYVGPKPDLLVAVQEGALLGGYKFDKYLSGKKEASIGVVAVTDGQTANRTKKQITDRGILHDCVNFARDVLNEPPNVIKPPSLANEFSRMGKKCGLQVTVWNDIRLAKEKCGGILGVGQGAKAKPRLVIGEYAPRGAKKHLCLVGKGVTYDTGGYNLKPADGLIGMKYDMGGAAATFAAACAIAALKLPIKLTVLTPLAENDISGEAYHTTSVLTTRSGRTIEVMNTDAEGRLILADALTIAGERKPDWIVDAATLTGACVVALGNDIAGAYGTDSAFTQKLIEAGQEEGELWWELPLHMPYNEQLKTTVADCKNIGQRWGGSITAALFLHKWVPEKVKWIHCDIAGPGTKEETLGHLGKGAKGFGVKTFVKLAGTLAR